LFEENSNLIISNIRILYFESFAVLMERLPGVRKKSRNCEKKQNGQGKVRELGQCSGTVLIRVSPKIFLLLLSVYIQPIFSNMLSTHTILTQYLQSRMFEHIFEHHTPNPHPCYFLSECAANTYNTHTVGTYNYMNSFWKTHSLSYK